MNSAGKIKKSVVAELVRQNEAMRELLEKWPAREIMMEFEKDWNDLRREFLSRNPPPDIDPRLTGEG